MVSKKGDTIDECQMLDVEGVKFQCDFRDLRLVCRASWILVGVIRSGPHLDRAMEEKRSGGKHR